MRYWKHSFKINRQSGFTLAEVLITLGIIGVVASITIPTLLQNKAKQETVAKLQKVYSTFMQANERSMVDNGPINTWFDGLAGTSGAGSLNFANTYVTPYLKISKNCGLAIDGDCYEKVYYLKSTSYDQYAFYSNGAKFFLSDGTFINFVNDFDANKRVVVNVDINGTKPPNMYGKDVFVFTYYSSKGQFLPSAYMLTKDELIDPSGSWNCNENSTYAGVRCAALIMQDSWQIKDYYPW